MSHTPGPWEISELHGSLIVNAGQDEDGYNLIPAQITGNAADPVYGHNVRANARLIAAAPSMYEALYTMHAKMLSMIADIEECMRKVTDYPQ